MGRNMYLGLRLRVLGVICKMDFKKAYNHVNSDFLVEYAKV